MQIEERKTAVAAALSAKKQPRTQVEELRELLRTIEKRLTRLKELSPEDVLGLLPLLDQARGMLDSLTDTGGEGLARSESGQFESLLLQFDKKGSTFVNRAGGPGALRRVRGETQPQPRHSI